jgi:hypothetical protein
MPRDIDYALARRAVLADVRRGALARTDVCDAHPELVRAARNMGQATDQSCPICEASGLRHISYVYGDKLNAPGGRAVADSAELRKLGRAHDELRCYVVEVCLECSWNYRLRTFLVGRRHAG